MQLQTMFFWFLLFLYLIPILAIGIYVIRKLCSIERLELLIPSGGIFGLSIFVFLIHLTAFFIKGVIGITIAYLSLFLVAKILSKLQIKSTKINIPSSRVLILYLLSSLFWATLIFWKGNFVLIGSDTNLYYSIASTFIKGNFPPQTPWQPDLPLAYHLGSSELLGAFHFFTNLSFEFLHIFFSSLFIFLSVQIIVWILVRHESIWSFIWGNLIALGVFVSFGFFKFIIPVFPIKLPEISGLHEFFLWLRGLPSVNESIEVYGAPINLDALIYFIHHAFGLAIMFSLISIISNTLRDKQLFSWLVLSVGLVALLQVNESIFVISAPALIFANFLNELRYKSLLANSKYATIALVFLTTAAILGGGIITNSIFPSEGLEKTILAFPRKADIKEDFVSYHLYQQISKAIPKQENWLPFSWFHIGVDLLVLIAVALIIFIQFSRGQKILIYTLLITGLSSLFEYNFIVPKYLVANGNRFLVFSFITLALLNLFALQIFFDGRTKNNWVVLLRKIALILFTLFVLAPTILPPLALLTKTRFGENKLQPQKEVKSRAIEWMNNHLDYTSRVVVLDAATPHPSGMARAMIGAGVLAPVFPSNFRAYTIEASPEYLDVAFFLSPKALKQLKIDILLVDSNYYKKIYWQRKDLLDNEKYFKAIYERENSDQSWEKVLEIKPEYYNQEEPAGTLNQLSQLPLLGKIFIDNEENFNPSFLRRAIIFSLRNRDLYFLPQSGVYLNVESAINQKDPNNNLKYDFMVLGKNTIPDKICNCSATNIWQGLNGEVIIWKPSLNI